MRNAAGRPATAWVATTLPATALVVTTLVATTLVATTWAAPRPAASRPAPAAGPGPLLDATPAIGSGPGLAPPRPDTAAILLALGKLRVLASVLYVGAHPDDENTRLIATLARGRLADTAYLSMTRGDGGQNLIGPEIGAGLGIIRSQELLAARRIDGGRQFFTRAIDFGYTKSPEETFRFWDKEQVLADTVRVFRQFQPDVVITRFPTDSRGGHGQHTASAILAKEAFAAAADPKRFPETAAWGGGWRPRRILWNTSRWFYDDEAQFKPDGLIAIDGGAWSPILGESFAELAARARSLHRSQGFGSEGSRGAVLDYMDHVDGERALQDLFEGVDTTWGRVEGGAAVDTILERARRGFDPEDPAGIVPLLLEARAAIMTLPAGRWPGVKRAEIDGVVAACLGLYLEAAAEIPSATPGEKLKIAFEAANRSRVAVRLRRITVPAGGIDDRSVRDLAINVPYQKTIEATLPADLPDSQPYWLRRQGTPGMFRVDDAALIGRPENRPALAAFFDLEIAGTPFTLERPVAFKWTDPARGELHRPFEVLPSVAVELSDPVLVFPDPTPRSVTVQVHLDGPSAAGTVRLEAPPGWRIDPPQRPFDLEKREATQRLVFAIHPPEAAAAGTIRAIATVGRRKFDRAVVHIDQPHLPMQVHMRAAETRVARIDLRRLGQEVGYLQGAGDQIPAGLRQIGYTVTDLAETDLDAAKLERFDAVILGVRAYNTIEALRVRQPALHAYVEAGGTLIVQYTTGHDLHVGAIAPIPLKIGRDRVTEEDAPVRFLRPDHPLLNVPNRITPADFEGWVQERGLYFASEWDPRFEAVISSNDTGEPPRDGGLLVARYGKGWFVYTGYSWFRQVPAGVPGAFRLLANLIALGRPAATTGGPGAAATDADRSR